MNTCSECGDLCMSTGGCLSYECSPTELKCNLNTRNIPQSGSVDYLDYVFCAKHELHLYAHRLPWAAFSHVEKGGNVVVTEEPDQEGWQNCAAIGGLKGNYGGRRGTAVCCASACEQCGKDNCLAGNSRVKQDKGVLWVENNCCMALRDLDKCNRIESLPCKCKNQRSCRKKAGGRVGPDDGSQSPEETSDHAPPPPPPPQPEGPPMEDGVRSKLNKYCADWRDQGHKSKADQLENMVSCMNQDCAQSMEEITCDYVTPETAGEKNAGEPCFCNRVRTTSHPLLLPPSPSALPDFCRLSCSFPISRLSRTLLHKSRAAILSRQPSES